MKTFFLFVLLVPAFSLMTGCAILTPPSAGWSNTAITKDGNGKIVESKYNRFVIGGVSDKENANSWANADAMASNNSQGVQSLKYRGKIANPTGRIIQAEINGPIKRSYYLKPRQKMNDELPPGKYQTTFYYGDEKVGWHEFTVNPNRTHFFEGEEVFWYVSQVK